MILEAIFLTNFEPTLFKSFLGITKSSDATGFNTSHFYAQHKLLALVSIMPVPKLRSAPFQY